MRLHLSFHGPQHRHQYAVLDVVYVHGCLIDFNCWFSCLYTSPRRTVLMWKCLSRNHLICSPDWLFSGRHLERLLQHFLAYRVLPSSLGVLLCCTLWTCMRETYKETSIAINVSARTFWFFEHLLVSTFTPALPHRSYTIKLLSSFQLTSESPLENKGHLIFQTTLQAVSWFLFNRKHDPR